MYNHKGNHKWNPKWNCRNIVPHLWLWNRKVNCKQNRTRNRKIFRYCYLRWQKMVIAW